MAAILIIEDNLDTARLAMKLLTPKGHSVIHAANALDGLRMARQTPPDLILLDINLPDLSGNVVALQLSDAAHANTVVIAFSADTADKTKRLAKNFGCDGFLCKPIDTRAFPSQVEELLKQGKDANARWIQASRDIPS